MSYFVQSFVWKLLGPMDKNLLPFLGVPFGQSSLSWVAKQIRGQRVAVIGCSDVSLLVSLVEQDFKVTAYGDPSSVEQVQLKYQNMPIPLQEALHQVKLFTMGRQFSLEWHLEAGGYGDCHRSVPWWRKAEIGYRVRPKPAGEERLLSGCHSAGVYFPAISSMWGRPGNRFWHWFGRTLFQSTCRSRMENCDSSGNSPVPVGITGVRSSPRYGLI